MRQTKSIKAFWELLRCSMSDSTPDTTIFDGLTTKEWESIYSMVNKHSVVGVIFPVIEKLPAEMRPGRKLYLNWCGMALWIKNKNQHMHEVYNSLNHLFEQNGIYPILLKGMGIATCYSQPLLRMAGDIDIYIVKRDYDAAIDILQKMGLKLKRYAEHDEFFFRNVHIELHTYTSHYGDIVENMKRVEFVSDGISKYRIPAVEANAYILIKHPARHLLTTGGAIRHLCDWAMFLQQNRGRISFDSVEEKLRSGGYDRFAMVFTALAVNYLGLSRIDVCQDWLDKSTKKQEDILWNDLMEKGDCGQIDWSNHFSMSKLPFSWTVFCGWITYYGKSYFRLIKLSVLFPDIIWKMQLERIGHRLKMVLIGKPFIPC